MIASTSPASLQEFTTAVYEYYHAHGRHDLPWRQADLTGEFDPYKILVSELMLQQTQVQRVIPKFALFLELFPNVQALAAAPLGEVLAAWSGLGYNRRAKFLWQAANTVVTDMGGVFPSTQAELTVLPGVGTNTAGAIAAYAYNQPVVFLETNIRTVFIHHFFEDAPEVHDKLLLPIVAQAVDQESPRDWYWALMDYGTYLKKTVGNATTRSAHYKKQSTFQGSKRQIRGQVIQILTTGSATHGSLEHEIQDPRLAAVLQELEIETLIQRRGTTYSL